MEKLALLLLRIEKVDLLIDAVVYKLYGLTAEEIEIVEADRPAARARRWRDHREASSTMAISSSVNP